MKYKQLQKIQKQKERNQMKHAVMLTKHQIYHKSQETHQPE